MQYTEKFLNMEEELLQKDLEELYKVKRNSFFEPFDIYQYKDSRLCYPVGISKLTNAGRILLGSSKSKKE